MTLGAAGNEMDDYPIDEEKVMAGKDDRIAPAVTAAVEMGFDAELATQAAKEQILLFPGRGDVTELVVEQLLMGAGGGARAFPAPTRMPEKYVAAAEAAAARGRAKATPEIAEAIPSNATAAMIPIWTRTSSGASVPRPTSAARVAFMLLADRPIDVATPQTVPKIARRSRVPPTARLEASAAGPVESTSRKRSGAPPR